MPERRPRISLSSSRGEERGLRPPRARIIAVSVVVLLGFTFHADASAGLRLLAPRDNAVVSRPPVLRWSGVSAATHYNVQLWRGNHKVLSRWPDRPRLELHRSWRFHGRSYRLSSARYRWYVWPGFGWGYGSFRRRDFVIGRPPANRGRPAIAGEPREGQVLTASTGAWKGTRPLRFSYRWLLCRTDGSTCASIPGATSARLLLGPEDIDATVRVVVTARNLAGSRSTTSAATSVVLPARPVLVSAPTLAGAFQQGGLVTATTGRWQSSRPVTFSFHWTRCELGGRQCHAISGATTAGYLLRSADFEDRVRVVVRATNSGGAADASTALSPVIGRVFVGTPAGDVLRGSVGADILRARAGSDRVVGGFGPDRLVGGRGLDSLIASDGNDFVYARDGGLDRVSCGRGDDVAFVDRQDRARRGCESVRAG
jgi:RTX calcium-binding nonapeptide repeat (4 copies)